ncbi:MAG TPA: ABC transporter ATP-binding protein [Xanthomonadaceae bacterium]|nr:ABC transporter ATP-binding protein [Xanthomonadaceae bacterium]
MTAAFTLAGIYKHYPHFALQDIDLSLPEGQIMGLVGVNGAGKTTLLRILTGLASPDAGTVEVLGHAMPREQVAAKRDIGFAAEDMRLYRGRSLRWHMDLIRAIYPSWDEAYAGDLLRRFDLRVDQAVGSFSHGQRVKALLLLNLARRPRLLLLDEPTTGLDPVARVEVLEALADVLREEARSVLFSSHNTRDVEQLADSITFLHQGRVLASQDKETFLDSWRRIVCQGAWTPDRQYLPELAAMQRNGSMLEIKVSGFSPDLNARLEARGLTVRSQHPMNLEDIFVATVRAGATS